MSNPMSAADHYNLAVSLSVDAEKHLGDPMALSLAAIAQVHATLAQACTLATALEPLAQASLARRN